MFTLSHGAFEFALFLPLIERMASFKRKMNVGQGAEKRTVKEWCIKWDRMIAAVTAIIVFSILLGLVIYHIMIEDGSHEDKSKDSIKKDKVQFAKSLVKCDLTYNPTIITCSDVTSNAELVQEIQETKDRTADYTIGLSLSNIQFDNQSLENGWLKAIQAEIANLEIRNCNLTNLGDAAFSGAPFEKLYTLTLAFLTLNSLRKKTFKDASITTLQLQNVVLKKVEKKVLVNISNLTTLQIPNLDSEQLEYFTGSYGVDLLYLQNLDLRGGNFGRLTNTSLSKATKVLQLYLSDCKITEIDATAFSQQNGALLIDLRNNSLTTLPRGIFDFIANCPPNLNIDISENYFNCNCEFQWFKDFVNNSRGINRFSCNGTDGELIDYQLVEFCPNESPIVPSTTLQIADTTSTTLQIADTTSTTLQVADATSTTLHIAESTSTTLQIAESTTTITALSTKTLTPTVSSSKKTTPITTPTPPQEKIIHVPCRNAKDFTKLLVIEEDIPVLQGEVDMKFDQDDDTPVYFLHIFGDIDNGSVLWINARTGELSGCLYGIPRRYAVLKIGNLTHDQTYSFCFIKSGEISSSPYNCKALHVPLDWPSQTWLPHKDLIPVVCGGCAVLLVLTLVTGFAVFYCVRQNPTLLKGNKRVIIVESKATDAVVMPRTYREMNYRPPSLNSYSDGYLTPKYNYYGRQTNPALRTISENNILKLRHNKSRFRKSSQIRRRINLEQLTEAFDGHFYEPPPLPPPNHPSQRQNNNCGTC